MRHHVLLCVGAILLVAAGSNGRVVKTRASVNIYDQNLVLKERAPITLAKGGAAIEDISKKGYVAIRLKGELVYLRLAEVVTEGMNTDPCPQIANVAGSKQQSHIAASIGAGSGMSGNTKPCL
ncbi:hypothetical protein ACFOKF_12825 [Sphingobium rhizovicinum]|uniref:Uncharacterized protein n=1 Tax=Sphingobium rhizovicinum TaxID=432308 RepID=A0ABV7NEW9_9SPHN